MILPALTYQPVTLPDAKLQAVHGADRPLCALVSALGSWLAGNRLLGAARGLDAGALERMFKSAFYSRLVPWHRACQLANAAVWRDSMPQDVCTLPIDGGRLGALTLSRYQVGAIRQLTTAGGLLGMSVGLGKTVTAVAAARHYLMHKLATDARCWIVAPLSALDAWKPYIGYLKTLFADVALISIDQAHKIVDLERAAGGVLIVDEIHQAGHTTARRTKSLFEARLAFDVCIGLTGTVSHSGIEAAMTMLDLALPGACPFATRWQSGEYFHCLVKKQLGGRSVTGLVKPVNEHKQKFLDWMARFCVVLTKHSSAVQADLLIPEQSLETVDMGISDETVDDCIVRIAMDLMAKNPKGELPHASAVMHAALAEGAAEKIDWLMENMDGTPVVLFAEYRATLAAARERLDAEKIPYVYVDGSVTGDERAKAVADFQAGAVDVFLGQIDAAGVAVNLFRSNVSVALDHTQRATSYAQALGRTCRRGQDRHCTHVDVIANPLQRICLERLRAAEDFHLDLARVRAALDSGRLAV